MKIKFNTLENMQTFARLCVTKELACKIDFSNKTVSMDESIFRLYFMGLDLR